MLDYALINKTHRAYKNLSIEIVAFDIHGRKLWTDSKTVKFIDKRSTVKVAHRIRKKIECNPYKLEWKIGNCDDCCLNKGGVKCDRGKTKCGDGTPLLEACLDKGCWVCD